MAAVSIKTVVEQVNQARKSRAFIWATFSVACFAALAGMAVSLTHVAHGLNPYTGGEVGADAPITFMAWCLAAIIDFSIIAGKLGSIAFPIVPRETEQRKEHMWDVWWVFWMGFLVSTGLNTWSFYQTALEKGQSPVLGALLGVGLMVLILKTASLAADAIKELLDVGNDIGEGESKLEELKIKAEEKAAKAKARREAAATKTVSKTKPSAKSKDKEEIATAADESEQSKPVTAKVRSRRTSPERQRQAA